MLLSQGDSQRSVSDTTSKIQRKLRDLINNSRDSGVMEGELLFVADMRHIIANIQHLSRAAMQNCRQEG